MHSPNFGFQSKFAIFALALLPVTFWLLMHGYHGIREDGQIYAFQAYARLHPQLAADLYLQNTSQDQYTLFSPLYGWFIGLLGLENAARLLTLIFSLWFLAATYGFTRVVAGRDAAWSAVAFLLIAAGDYGGSGVFQILDPFLTARLPAEALIISALFCHVRRMEGTRVIADVSSRLFIHPLMALPGLLTIVVVLWLPLRHQRRRHHRRRVSYTRPCGRGRLHASVFACYYRHGCLLDGGGAREISIFVSATLVDARLGPQCPPVHLFGVHGVRCNRRENTQTLAWRLPS